MRLALVCDWYPPRVGGIEGHVRALAEQLAAAGHAVDVITTVAGCQHDPPRPEGPRAAPGFGALDAGPRGAGRGAVRVHRLALPYVPGAAVAAAPRATVAAVTAAVARGGYDLVHAHASVFSPLAFAGAAASGRLGVPAVVTHHSVLGVAGHAFTAADRLLGWTRWPVLHTAVSPLVAGEVAAAARRRGVALPVRVLPNGIHAGAWAARAARGGRPVGEFRVASVMRLAGRKRPLALATIAERVPAALPSGVRLRLRVAGDGPERAALERLLARRRLGDVVELLGWQPPEQVCALYAASDAFVLPAILESFGIAALEARCAGLPVVAMRQAGPSAFIRHGVEGLLADDDAGLAAQLVRLATDDRLRAAIAHHNRATEPAETWSAVLERHHTVYAEARQVAGPAALRPVRPQALADPAA